MRHIFQSVFQDLNGLGVAAGDITVYLAGTTTLATIYTVSSGGSADSDSIVQSDSTGHYLFYIDETDYRSTQLFKIVLSKAEFVTVTYDNVPIIMMGNIITLGEQSTTPSNPTDGTELNVYMKDDKLIIQYNDGGTVRYKYLGLTGTGVTWTHTTTAP